MSPTELALLPLQSPKNSHFPVEWKTELACGWGKGGGGGGGRCEEQDVRFLGGGERGRV